ncbi:MAG: hypothetical protein AAAC47_08905 [Pararhizobium sp.]
MTRILVWGGPGLAIVVIKAAAGTSGFPAGLALPFIASIVFHDKSCRVGKVMGRFQLAGRHAIDAAGNLFVAEWGRVVFFASTRRAVNQHRTE